MVQDPPEITPLVTDPNFANVVLLCHFDGTNGATTFTDSSLAAHTVTGSGGPALTTAQAKFGTASLQCSGAGSAVSADSPDWDFGAGQFTVEAWVRSTHSISGLETIATQGTISSNMSWLFVFQGAQLNFYYSTTGANNIAVTVGYTAPLNTWFHVAVDRDVGNMVRVYADGVVLIAAPRADTFFNSSDPLRIGSDPTNGWALTGQIDEVRITKGLARYAGAFTPPTAAFPEGAVAGGGTAQARALVLA